MSEVFYDTEEKEYVHCPHCDAVQLLSYDIFQNILNYEGRDPLVLGCEKCNKLYSVRYNERLDAYSTFPKHRRAGDE